ncbi:MAG: hypothetical protein J0J04_08615 [Microbacterium sp.]|uniref:hypothetical protein n=1 Tax=Microbacterium sp. TaxID=51671 RepID=UPI001AD0FB55|nr:hypothetical protein [Microbacterium sp.]MBN9214839.1 hypothetical protein [Microbacterium sp.]
MANPFLVLGGVAVGVITAGIGVLQVPGWIDSANDSAVTNDLSQVALSEEAAVTVVGSYVSEDDLLSGEANGEKTGVKFQPSSGVVTEIALNTTEDAWAAIGVSKSGHVFVRTSDATTTYKSTEKVADGATISADDFASLPAGVTVGGTKAAPTISLAG